MINNRFSPIGLDLGTREIIAVQSRAGAIIARCAIPRVDLDRSGGDEPASTAPATDDRALSFVAAGTLAAILHRRGFIGQRVVLSAPPGRRVVMPLQMPPRSSQAPLDEIARGQLAEAARCGPDEIEGAWWALPVVGVAPAPPTGKEPTHALGVAMSRHDVESVIEPLEAAGFEVCAMDVKSLALVRALERQVAGGAGKARVMAIVNFGYGGAGVIMVHRGRVVYERDLPGVGLDFTESALTGAIGVEADVAHHVVMGAGVTRPEAIGSVGARPWALLPQAQEIIQSHVRAVASEVQKALDYALARFGKPGTGGPESAVMVVGAGASVPGLPELLGREACGEAGIVPGCGTDRTVADRVWPSLIGALGLSMHPLRVQTAMEVAA